MPVYATELAKVSLTWAPNETDWEGELAVNTFWLQHNHFTGNDFTWSTAVQSISDTILDKFTDHWAGVEGLFAGGYQIQTIKCAQIDSTGHAVSQGTTPVTSGTLVGTGTSGVLPPEVALVLSLYGYPPGAFVPQRGRKRGRMYLPYLAGSTLSANGKVSSAAMDTAMSGFGAIFNDIQGMHVGVPVPPTNSSDYMALVVASGFGIATQVDHLAIDNLFDAQRRRQNRATATKETVTIEHG